MGDRAMKKQDILQLAQKRKSSRMPFDENRAIAPDDLHIILEAAAYAPTAHNMQNFQIVVIDDKSLLSALSELDSPPVSPEFIQENLREVSFTEDELNRRKTGMLASQFPPAWFTPEARQGRIDAQPQHKLGEEVRKGPILLLVLYDPNRRAPGSEGDFLGIMSLGFMMENMWLAATAQDIGLRIISAFGDDPLASEVKKIIGIPSSLKIALGCRLGYPIGKGTVKARLHRDVQDFVFMNKYKDN